MGTVYEGWDPIIARRVAIKTVRLPDSADPETEEALARFRREAQAAGRLTHPNIVGVFDYGETNDLAYIVMEFVDGPPLKTLLDKQERFALADTIRVMEDLLAGLQFSHERGVVHRDIKPANVMLTSAGQAKIADFGIARIESSSMTQAGTVLGTPAYMSPEQFMGQVVDARTDIYSSGVLLYQLLTGERPFEGGMSAIMHKALNTEPPAPSQLSVTAPPAFDAVVRRAMAKRPEDRYPVGQRLRRSDAGRPGATRRNPRSAATKRPWFSAAASRRLAPPSRRRHPRRAGECPAAARTMPIARRRGGGARVLGGGGAWWFLSRAPAPVIATHPAGAASGRGGLSGARQRPDPGATPQRNQPPVPRSRSRRQCSRMPAARFGRARCAAPPDRPVGEQPELCGSGRRRRRGWRGEAERPGQRSLDRGTCGRVWRHWCRPARSTGVSQAWTRRSARR